MTHRTASDVLPKGAGRRLPEDGARRVIVEHPSPEVDGGRYPVKRSLGETVVLEVDLLADGHDAIAGRALFRPAAAERWQVAPLLPLGNDRFSASFVATQLGVWEVAFEGWIDTFTTWRRDTEKKRAAEQDIAIELLVGARLIGTPAKRAATAAPNLVARLEAAAHGAGDTSRSLGERLAAATGDLVVRAMADAPELATATRAERMLRILVEPELARFSAWYELFPRSCGEHGEHGTFADVERRLDVRRRHGLRHPLPAADPSDRPRVPQGAEQHAERRAERPRQPMGDRRRRRRAQGGASRARNARRLRSPRQGGSAPRSSRSRSTSPSRSRPTIPT